jgi:hypothetical protein
MSIISESEGVATMTINHYQRILRELAEARELLESEKITRNYIIQRGIDMQKELNEAREKLENVKLQLGLWEDGNLICEETRGEIRLFEEKIKQALLERNKAYKIAERAIEDLAWFNETNAQTLRDELEQLKEEAK